MTCANEFSSVLGEFLNLEAVDPDQPHTPQTADVWFIVAISFKQLIQIYDRIRNHVPPSARVVGYVFDGYFSNRIQKAPKVLRDHMLYTARLSKFHRVFNPFKELVDEQNQTISNKIEYLPIGVDCLRFGSNFDFDKRFVDVNAYGRQPTHLINHLSDRMNANSTAVCNFTSHMQITSLSDPERHRDLFWNLLRHSKIALAFSPESCDPNGRFPCSFLGQRWYEGLAAGCIILGRRPRASEVSQQLDWTDSTIELPDHLEEADDVIASLLKDRDRFGAISAANYRNCLERHDWRARIVAMNEFDDIIDPEQLDAWREAIYRISR